MPPKPWPKFPVEFIGGPADGYVGMRTIYGQTIVLVGTTTGRWHFYNEFDHSLGSTGTFYGYTASPHAWDPLPPGQARRRMVLVDISRPG